MSADLSRDEERLPSDALRKVDHLCDDFEQQRDDGGQPRIEDMLSKAGDLEQSVLLRYLIQSELEHRCRSGDRPSVDEYHARFPQHRRLVSEEFACFPWRDVAGPDPHASPVTGDETDDSGRVRGWPAPLGGRYTIRSEIGRGGSAVVLLADDEELGRRVAIKVPRADRPLDVDFYIQEAQTVAQLTHPAVVQVYDVGRDEQGGPFVIMQYIDGPSLAEYLKSGRPSPTRTAQLLAQVAEAVHHAHQLGFVHRDLKPSNILLDQDGNPYVSDFGLALHERAQSQHRGDYSGTPLYRSPEQVRGEADWMDGRCDIWALGIVLYEMLTGRRPFRTGEEIQFRPPKPPRQIDDAIPEPLERICLKCLSKVADDRCPTADVLARDLRAAFATLVAEGIGTCDDPDGSSVLSRRDNIIIIHTGAPVDEAKAGVSDSIGPNPYKGLFAFGEADADRFFGREELTEDLCRRFRNLQEDTRREKATVRLLPIVGPSGCGKSSLVRAGLIATLAQDPLTDWQDIRVVVFHPGAYPVPSLANALARLLTDEAVPLAKSAELQHMLRQRHGGRYEGLRQIAAALSQNRSSPLIVFVDQMDEIYSLCDDTEERDVFLSNLLEAAGEIGGPVSVLLTIRSDFLGDTQDHPQLNALVAEQGVIIPAMNKDQLRAAIAEPAESAGHPLDAASVDLLVEQTYGREGALPLLQFALSRIWDGLAEGVEAADTLKRLDGVGGALSGEAQRIFDSLDQEDQEVARRVFLSLVQLGQGTPDTRRRVPVQGLVAQGEDPTRIREVIRRFSTPGARLLTLSAAEDGAELVEVTHEAIFDNWQLLRHWIDDNRADIRFQRRLDEAARHWDQEGRPEGLLWRSPDLDRLRQFHARSRKEMTPVQVQFFARSCQVQDEDLRRQKRRVRLLQMAAVVFAVLATAATFLGFQARRYAAYARERLVRLNLTEGIRRMDDGDLMGALPKLVEAFRLDQENPQHGPCHRLRLGAVLARCPKPIQVFHDPRMIVYAELSPDDRHLSMAARDGSVWIWDVITGESLLRIDAHKDSVRIASFSPDGRKLITASRGGTARVWDAQTGLPLTKPLQHKKGLWHAAFSPDGEYAVTSSEDNTAAIWELATGTRIVEQLAHGDDVKCAVFSPDGRYVVTASLDGSARVWNARDGQPVTDPLVHDGPVFFASFNRDGTRVLTASDDTTARYWSIATGEPAGPSMVHDHWVRFAASGPRGRFLATASFDGTAKLWDARNRVSLVSTTRHTHFVNHVAFDRDGRWLAAASSDGTVRIISTTTGRPVVPLLRHSDGVSRVFFRAQRREVVTVAQDGLVRVWRIPPETARHGIRLPHREVVTHAAISPGKRHIVTARRDDTARIWDSATGRLVVWPLVLSRDYSGALETAAFSPDGGTLVTCGLVEDQLRVATLWEVESGSPTAQGGYLSAVHDVVFSPSGGHFATLERIRGSVHILDRAGTILHEARVPSDERLLHAAFTPDGRRLAVASGTAEGTCGYVRFFPMTDSSPVPLSHDGRIVKTDSQVNYVAFSPDGKQFVTATGATFYSSMGVLDTPGKACVWETASREMITSPMVHPEAVTKTIFSPDGSRIATVVANHSIRVWDASQGYPVSPPMRFDNSVRDVAFSDDGRYLSAAIGPQHPLSRQSGYARLWDCETGDPVTPRLENAGHMLAAGFLDDRVRCVTVGGQGGRIWQFPADGRPLEDLITVGQVLSGQTTDDRESPTLLSPEQYVDAWRCLHRTDPEEFARTTVRAADDRTNAGGDDNAASPRPGNLVGGGSLWKYSADGVDLGTAWREPEYDDSAWPSGIAQLGFGEFDEATVTDSASAPVTSYFRHSFAVADPQAVGPLLLTLLCDDGAHVYLNGTRVATSNVRPGAAFDEPAIESVDGMFEDIESCFVIDPELVVAGENVLAVEVHQAEDRSVDKQDWDLSLDLTLTANATSVYTAVLNESKVPWDRAQAAHFLGQLGMTDASAGEALKPAARDANALVRAWATAALLQFDFAPPDADELHVEGVRSDYLRSVLTNYLNQQSWHVAKVAGLSDVEYRLRLKMARAACAIMPDDFNCQNTLGIIQYRVRQYQEAIASLQKSRKLLQGDRSDLGMGVDATNLLFMAMAYHWSGETDRAAEHLEQGLDLIKKGKSASDLAMRLFREEAETLIRGPSDSTPEVVP